MPSVAIDPFDDAFLADPYAYHDELRRSGPVFWLERYGIYGMARHAEVAVALKDWQTYCSGRGVGLADFAREPPWRPPSLLLETDPPDHDRARKIVNTVVSLKSLAELQPRWREKAEQLADMLVRRRRFDAITDLAEIYPLSVFPDTIGIRTDGREHLLPYGSVAFNAFGPRNALALEAERSSATHVSWIADSCRQENLLPGGWGAAVHASADAGDCTREEAERLVRSFLTAGLDTTVNGIGNMMHAFVRFPSEWTKLHGDPNLARRAFEEALRWDSTVQTFFRTTTREVDVGGAAIPEGSKLLLFLAAANRDPDRWPNPDQFDISRPPGLHVGFGVGLHQCLGQMVARQEASLVLEALVPRVATMRQVGPAVRRLNNTLHALASLPVEVDPI